MSEIPSDLGHQEPRGCRYVYGDPGGDWHFCQRHLADGARPGDPAHPPYCARHTRVCVPEESDAARIRRMKFLERIAQGASWFDTQQPGQGNPAGMSARLDIDIVLKLRERGVFHYD